MMALANIQQNMSCQRPQQFQKSQKPSYLLVFIIIMESLQTIYPDSAGEIRRKDPLKSNEQGKGKGNPQNGQDMKTKNAANYAQKQAKQATGKQRTKGSMFWFIIIIIFTAAIPFINLLLFLFQNGGLSNTVAKSVKKTNNLDDVWAQIDIEDAGRDHSDFDLFYVVIALYLIISLTFIVYSCFFGPTLKKRLKLFFMVDNILICMIATNIAYAYLHIICFTTTYKTDENFMIQTGNQVTAEDIVCIILYCVTNFALTGIFRVLMVYVDWKPWQIILYKMAIISSSMTYVVVGLIYLGGKDQVSEQIDTYQKGVVLLIEDLLWKTGYNYQTSTLDPFYLSVAMYLDRTVVGIKDVQSTMDNFMLLFVFSNFAFSFEIVAKLTDFDGTSDLKTKYRLIDPQD